MAAAGHDVAIVADLSPAADDRHVLRLARDQQRVLITFDADFGDLVYQQREPAPPAIVFLRLHPIDGVLAGSLTETYGNVTPEALAQRAAGAGLRPRRRVATGDQRPQRRTRPGR
jgi:predicted nuclease of predicted toxin-antitoxin system